MPELTNRLFSAASLLRILYRQNREHPRTPLNTQRISYSLATTRYVDAVLLHHKKNTRYFNALVIGCPERWVRELTLITEGANPKKMKFFLVQLPLLPPPSANHSDMDNCPCDRCEAIGAILNQSQKEEL